MSRLVTVVLTLKEAAAISRAIGFIDAGELESWAEDPRDAARFSEAGKRAQAKVNAAAAAAREKKKASVDRREGSLPIPLPVGVRFAANPERERLLRDLEQDTEEGGE